MHVSDVTSVSICGPRAAGSVTSCPMRDGDSHVRQDVALHRGDDVGKHVGVRRFARQYANTGERRCVDRALALRSHHLRVTDVDDERTKSEQHDRQKRDKHSDRAVLISAAATDAPNHVHQPQPPGGESSSAPESACWFAGATVLDLRRQPSSESDRRHAWQRHVPREALDVDDLTDNNCCPGNQPGGLAPGWRVVREHHLDVRLARDRARVGLHQHISAAV